MRRLLWCTVVGLLLAPLVGLGSAYGSGEKDKAEAAACGSHGTQVTFVDTPKEAAAQAKKEQKLVFVLHVSGNFEDPRFT